MKWFFFWWGLCAVVFLFERIFPAQMWEIAIGHAGFCLGASFIMIVDIYRMKREMKKR